MSRKQYEADNLPTQIVIGRQTETGVMSIYFDCTGWLTWWPNLTLSIWVTPPGGSSAYLATTHMEDKLLVWDVDNADTATAGQGTMEIVGTASGQRKLSAVTATKILASTTTKVTNPPEKGQSFLDQMAAATAKAEDATAAAKAAAAQADAAAGRAAAITETATAAETDRVQAESIRAANETNRVDAESLRADAETGRAQAESDRAAAETQRQSAEQDRAIAEQQRATAETARAEAETQRQSAEAERRETFAGFEGEIGSLKDDLSHVLTKTQDEKSNTYDRIAFIGNKNPKKICISSDSECSVQICGKNILDISEVSSRKIKNDSGAEIDDYNGRYNLNMIPVNPGETIYIGFGAQRVYQYDGNGDWLRRTGAHDQTSNYGTFIVPDDCFFVQFQWNTKDSINKDTPQVERGSVGTEYEVYESSSVTVTTEQTEIIIPAYATVYSSSNPFTTTEYGEIAYYPNDEFKKAILDTHIVVPACADYPIWEPNETTDEYSSAIGVNQVTISISLAEFLAEYFDKYIGVNADGYKVTKRSIGRDSSNEYEIMEYTFRPERYNRTILLSAGMNPCETSPMFGVAYLVKSIMDGTDEPGLNYLRENVRFVIMPCIAPWGFDQSPLKYYNYNGVRINKNFDYNGSWKQMPSNEHPGESADSEAETKILKAWLSQWANRAELWIDCHSDTFGNTPRLHQVITSSSEVGAIIQPVQQRITNYYVNKGYIEDSTASDVQPSWWTSPLTNYPKTLYSEKIDGIPAFMIEQYVNGTFYGSDGTHNNDSYGIKNYVLMLRAFILAYLKRDAISVNTGAVSWMAYQYSLN